MAAADILNVTNGALIDLDGAIRRGEELIEGAPNAVSFLRDQGIDVLFITNNPTETPQTVATKLRRKGIDIECDEILTSGSVAARCLAENYPDASILVIGESGLISLLEDVKIVQDPRQADILLASLDRDLDYATLTKGLRTLEHGATFVATSPDGSIPHPDGPVPGTGAIVGALTAATGRDPDIVSGKPSSIMRHAAIERLGVDPNECLVIGDRLDTDMELATEAMTSVLVETGRHGRQDVGRVGTKPSHVIESIAAIETIL